MQAKWSATDMPRLYITWLCSGCHSCRQANTMSHGLNLSNLFCINTSNTNNHSCTLALICWHSPQITPDSPWSSYGHLPNLSSFSLSLATRSLVRDTGGYTPGMWGPTPDPWAPGGRASAPTGGYPNRRCSSSQCGSRGVALSGRRRSIPERDKQSQLQFYIP